MSGDPSIYGPEDKRQHLIFIQDAIARMAHASSTTKGWLLPVVTAAYGFAVVGHSGTVALVGIIATIAFAYLDANYLRQEHCFRALYDAVASGDSRVPPFSMRWSDVMPTPDGYQNIFARWIPQKSVWLSWSIAPFYGTLIVVGLGSLLYGTFT